MRLRRKIRYILLPIIVVVFTMSASVYYNDYKEQIIANTLSSLNERLQEIELTGKYHLAYTKSYIQQKIDSKEASLILEVIKQDKELAAPYVTQLVKSFVDQPNDSNYSSKIVNDFTIYGFEKEVLFHVNTSDPFSKTALHQDTEEIIDRAHLGDSAKKRLSQYYYFIENDSDSDSDSDTQYFTMNIVMIFSPFYLSSKPFYDKIDDLYLIQTEMNVDFLKDEVGRLIDEHNGYLNFTFTNKNVVTDHLSINGSRLKEPVNGLYKSIYSTELFDLYFSLDEKYFDEKLWNIIEKLIFLNTILILSCYLFLLFMIDRQIIFPITNLAKSIKQVEVSSSIKLKPLDTKDEVADLNESYISLINKINNLASNDALTGLSNRRSFNKQLSLVNECGKNKQTYVALFFIDLDNFKYVNDTFGHDAGDQLLVAFSQRLKQTLRSEDKFVRANMINSIARLGGDEFVILMENLPSLDVIESIAKRICALFTNGFVVGNKVFDVHASIGIAYSNDNYDDGETLLNQADSAMYMAKRAGKNTYKVFSPEIKAQIHQDKAVQKELVFALMNNEFYLVFMPAYSASTLKLQGYELLLRCPALNENEIGPDLFIPIAEKTDLIIKIDMWVCTNALIKLEQMVKVNKFTGFFSINISSRSLKDDQLCNHLQVLIEKHNINTTQLELEITESCLMSDDNKAIATLKRLKTLGIRIALDHFGTGYTSFSQLVNYPLDTLKIDRSFIKELAKSPTGKKPTLDIIYELAKVYQLEVIVEGVETQTDFQHVKNLGCDIVQGFYFTKPLAWQDVIDGKFN